MRTGIYETLQNKLNAGVKEMCLTHKELEVLCGEITGNPHVTNLSLPHSSLYSVLGMKIKIVPEYRLLDIG